MRIVGEWRLFSDGVTRPVVTAEMASDLCVLGRDVTDNFDLILSRRRRDALLLAPTHQYQIVRT